MKSCPVHTGVLAVCLVTIFGYLNSVHVYETFRLVNGASLGIGICVLLIADLYRYGNKPIQWILAAAGVWSVLWLSATLFFIRPRHLIIHGKGNSLGGRNQK